MNSFASLVQVLDARVGVVVVELAVPSPPHVVVSEDSLLSEKFNLPKASTSAGVAEAAAGGSNGGKGIFE